MTDSTASAPPNRFFIILTVVLNTFCLYEWWTLISFDRLNPNPPIFSLKVYIGAAVVLHGLSLAFAMVQAYREGQATPAWVKRASFAVCLFALALSLTLLSGLLRLGTIEEELRDPTGAAEQCIEPPETSFDPA